MWSAWRASDSGSVSWITGRTPLSTQNRTSRSSSSRVPIVDPTIDSCRKYTRLSSVGGANPLLLEFLDAALDRRLVQTATPTQGSVEIDVGVLHDAGAVIHQADHAHTRMVSHGVEQRQHVRGRHLTSQVQKVVGL